MGRIIMMLYEDAQENFEFESGFIDKHHAFIGEKVIDRFELPRVLRIIVNQPCFTVVKKDSLALQSVVDMAHAVVDDSFRKYGKFRVLSPMPDPEGIVYNSTMGVIFKEHFQIMGLGSYIDVMAAEWSDVERRYYEKHKPKEE